MTVPSTHEKAQQMLTTAVLLAPEKQLRRLFYFGDRQWTLCTDLRQRAKNTPHSEIAGIISRSEKLKKIIAKRSNPDNWKLLAEIVQGLETEGGRDSDWEEISEPTPKSSCNISEDMFSSDSSDERIVRPNGQQLPVPLPYMHTLPWWQQEPSKIHNVWNHERPVPRQRGQIAPSVASEIGKKEEQLPLAKQLIIQEVVDAMLQSTKN